MSLKSEPYLPRVDLVFNAIDGGDAATVAFGEERSGGDAATAVWTEEYSGGDATTTTLTTMAWSGGNANNNH